MLIHVGPFGDNRLEHLSVIQNVLMSNNGRPDSRGFPPSAQCGSLIQVGN